MKRWLFALLLLGPASFASAQVNIQADMPAVVEQGGFARASFSLQLLEGQADLSEGVWFLNVIEPLAGGEVRQVASQLFSSANEEGKVFRQVFSSSELTAGLSTVLEFRLRPGAPPGDYLIALQLYSGRTTNPSRVDPGRRVAMQFLPFTVVAGGG